MEDFQKMIVLIDADNTQLNKLDEVMHEISTYGRIIVKKAYGNFTKPQLHKWESKIKTLAIKAEQQFDYVAGKNTTDIALVIDAMADAGVLNGLSRADSIRLAAQSVLGAAKMVLDTGKHPDALRDEVCSPGGTTIVGVRAAEDMGLRSAMIAAVDSTIEKSREMSRGQ